MRARWNAASLLLDSSQAAREKWLRAPECDRRGREDRERRGRRLPRVNRHKTTQGETAKARTPSMVNTGWGIDRVQDRGMSQGPIHTINERNTWRKGGGVVGRRRQLCKVRRNELNSG